MHQPFAEKLPARQRYFLLASLIIALFLGALDQTVVSTAIPRVVAELEGFSLLSWLFTSYMLTSTVVVPLVGKLGDLYGRKLFLMGGVIIFILGSVLCGAAQSMTMLIVFRAFQGLGGGMIFASVFATLGDAFSPAERGKYVGLFSGTFGIASISGPALGGFITDNLGWRWIFYLNVPVALIALPAIWYNIPSVTNRRKVKLDVLGSVLLTVASVLLLLGFVWAGDKYAWGSAQIIGLLLGAAVFVGLFIAWEAKHPEPVLPLGLFRNRVFLMANLVGFTFGLGVFGAFQYLGIFVQTALGASATASGIISTPQSIGNLLTSIIGGQIISRYGKYKWQTVVGTLFIAAAMAMLRTLDVSTPKWHISAYVVILGLGFGLVMPTMSLIVQNAVAPQFIGVATSSSQFFRQIGSVIGIAIFGAVLTNVYTGEFETRFDEADRATVGPAITAQLEDPTSRLNEGQFARLETEVGALPDGPALLDRAKDAQAESVALAVRWIYTGSLIAALASVAFALALKELPLRRAMPGPAPAAPPAVADPAG